MLCSESCKEGLKQDKYLNNSARELSQNKQDQNPKPQCCSYPSCASFFSARAGSESPSRRGKRLLQGPQRPGVGILNFATKRQPLQSLAALTAFVGPPSRCLLQKSKKSKVPRYPVVEHSDGFVIQRGHAACGKGRSKVVCSASISRHRQREWHCWIWRSMSLKAGSRQRVSNTSSAR